MSRLGQYLISRGLITRDQLEDALSHQAVHGARLGTNLVELGSISVEQLAACLGDFHKTPLPERSWLEKPQRAATQRATRTLVERIRFIPMRLEGKVLHAALLDPRHPNVLDDLRFATGCRIQPYVLPEIWMHDWLLHLFKLPRGIRHVETRGNLDPEPHAAVLAQRTSAGTRPSHAPARGARPPLTQPPPKFESIRSAPLTGLTNPPPIFETTAVSHAKATTPPNQSRPLSGLPPIPSQRVSSTPPTAPRIGSRGPTSPPPFIPPAARHGMSVRPPPVPVPRLSDPPPPSSIEQTFWNWRPPQTPAVPLSFEPDREPSAPGDSGPIELPDEHAGGSLQPPPSQAAAPAATRSGTPAGLWRESVPPAASELIEEGPADLEPPPVAEVEAPPPSTLDELEPATAAQTLALDLTAWEAELLSAPNRDQLIEVSFRIASCFATHVALFIVHQGMVQGQGCMELGIARALEGVLIPLDADSALTLTANRGEPLRAALSEREVDQRVSLILCDDAREVALFPVAIKQRVVNVLYASTGGEPLGAIAFGALSQLAQQMGAAYEQLIRTRKASTSAG
jgi:hypothetical protein